MNDELDDKFAKQLVREGWKGTSNKNRTIARLPKGKTGLEALCERSPEDYRRIMANAERQAADTYRRMYANGEDDTRKDLSFDMWVAFKRAGGEASW